LLTRIEWKPARLHAQLLEVIAGRHPQVLIGRRVVDHLELAKEPAFEIGRDVPRSVPFVPAA